MIPAEPTSIAQILAGAAATVLVVILAGQKVLKGWQATSTESSVMNILHTELERMSAQNTLLSVELGKLQKEVVTLSQELRKLNTENQYLHAEVTLLTQEVTLLQSTLAVQNDAKST